MRVKILKNRPDIGQIRDMPTMMARAALKAGTVEMEAKDVCQLCGGLFEEVPTLRTEPRKFRCAVCGAPVLDEPEKPKAPEPKLPRRSKRARAAAAGANE